MRDESKPAGTPLGSIGRRQWLTVAVLGAAVGGRDARAAPSPAEPRSWLARLQGAVTTSFSGTYVVTVGAVATSSRIVHAWDGRQSFELVESLDGPAHQVLRHDDVVKTVWPDRRAVLVERRAHDVSFPFLLRAAGPRIGEHYDWSQVGIERVAGHEAAVLLLRPRDEFRLAYRLWSDRRTGLLLRADALGPRGDVLESSAFSQVAVAAKPALAEIQQAIQRASTYQVIKSPYTPTDLRREGWMLDPLVAGFQAVSCVRRPAPKSVNGLVPTTGAPERAMIQAVYSDGLGSVSVFIEPIDRDAMGPPGSGAAGSLSTVTRLRDAWRVTVVGDVPTVTLERFADGLRRVGS